VPQLKEIKVGRNKKHIKFKDLYRKSSVYIIYLYFMRLLDQRSLFMFIHPVDIPKFTHLSHCTTCSLRQEKRWVGTNFFGITDHVESVG